MPKILQDAFWGEISIFEKKLSQGKFEKYLENFLVDVHLIDHCALEYAELLRTKELVTKPFHKTRQIGPSSYYTLTNKQTSLSGSKRVNPGPLTKSRLTFFGVHRGNFHHWRLLSFPWWRGLFLKLLINTGSITSSCTTFVIGTLPLEHQQWVVGCTVGDNCTIFFLTKKCLKDFC